jgi:ATP-dependent helicase/DNAse subunit B
LVEEAAKRVARPEFERVTEFAGFRASLAKTMQEFSSAGCDSARLAACLPETPLGDAFLAVYREVDRELARRGLAMRGRRLERAAEKIAGEGLRGIRTIWLDGFQALPDPELRVIGAMGRHAELTLAMSDADLTETMVARLSELEFSLEALGGGRTRAAIQVVKAPGIEREVEEIARRILEQAEAGRPFREMGVIVRTQEIYAPVLRSTLERFGIPARFYFDEPLERHAAVRFLAGAVDAMLEGWDHARTLAVLRLSPRLADWEAADRWDFAVREQTPNAGLSCLRELLRDGEGHVSKGAERVERALDELGALEEWRAIALPPDAWAARLGTLRNLFHPARPAQSITHEQALELRSQAAVLKLFEDVLREAAEASGSARPVPLEEYWRAVKSVLRLTPLRVPDGRRNVVHVMSAHEARQWVLPVVYVCGLVEKQFPKFHPQDPFFGDAARCGLNAAGIRVRTVAEFEREEHALFDAAVSRATMLVTLSYPEFDARGERTLPSIFLESLLTPAENSRAARPATRAAAGHRGAARIGGADVLEYVRSRTARVSPSGLEKYLQCPFQYFTQHVLHLEKAPERPEKRLNPLVTGIIVHAVLKEWWTERQDVTTLFERVFAEQLESAHIPGGYLTERARNELLDDLLRFTSEDAWPRAGFTSDTEIGFTLPLEGVEVKGRIDRMDVAADGSAYVIDYKYSVAASVKAKLKDETLLQAPLYLMAAEHLQKRPLGMFYAGVKGELVYAGWAHGPVAGVAPDGLPMPEGWLESARERTLEIVREIRAGRVEALPADLKKCAYCDARDVCRIDVEAVRTVAEGA